MNKKIVKFTIIMLLYSYTMQAQDYSLLPNSYLAILLKPDNKKLSFSPTDIDVTTNKIYLSGLTNTHTLAHIETDFKGKTMTTKLHDLTFNLTDSLQKYKSDAFKIKALLNEKGILVGDNSCIEGENVSTLFAFSLEKGGNDSRLFSNTFKLNGGKTDTTIELIDVTQDVNNNIYIFQQYKLKSQLSELAFFKIKNKNYEYYDFFPDPIPITSVAGELTFNKSGELIFAYTALTNLSNNTKEKTADLFIGDVDTSGTLKSIKTYRDLSGRNLRVAHTSMNNKSTVYVCGESSSKDFENKLFISWLPNGNSNINYKEISGYPGRRCEIKNLLTSASNRLFVIGKSISKVNNDANVFVIKLDSNCNELWRWEFKSGVDVNDIPYSAVVDSKENLFVAGTSSINYFLTQLNSVGHLNYSEIFYKPVLNRQEILYDKKFIPIHLRLDKNENLFCLYDSFDYVQNRHFGFLRIYERRKVKN